MDLNQVLNFVRFHEGRKESVLAQRRAEESALLSREKFALQKTRFAFDMGKELQRMREKEIDNEKWVISSYTDSYHKAKTMGEKRAIRELSKSYYYSLSGNHRRALEPVISHSPLSPMEEKREEFWRVHGASFPRRPSPEEWKDNPGIVAKYKFDLLDFERRQSLFLTGQAKPVPKFVGLDKETMAMKSESGMIHILDKEESGFHKAADEAGVPVSELYGSGGILPSKTPTGTITMEGKIWELYPQRDIFSGKYSVRRKLVGDASKGSSEQLPGSTRKLLEDVAFGNPDNVTAVAIREAIDEGEEGRIAVAQFLTTTNPGFRFSFGESMGLKSAMTRFLIGLTMVPRAFFTLTRGKLKRDRVSLFITQGESRMIEVPDYGRHEVFVKPDGTVLDLSGQVIGRSGEEAIGRLAEEFRRAGMEKVVRRIEYAR